MSYATIADMQKRFTQRELVELSDKDGSQGEIVTAVIEQALTDAKSQIDGYLSGRYQLPLNPVPAVLIKTCCDLARYALYENEPSDTVTKRYDEAVRFLKLIADGKVTLGLSDSDKPTSNDLPQVQSAGTVFSREKSKGFL